MGAYWWLVRFATGGRESRARGLTRLNEALHRSDGERLSVRLRGKGAKTTAKNGAAHFQTPDFRDSALIHLTKSLPAETCGCIEEGEAPSPASKTPQ